MVSAAGPIKKLRTLPSGQLPAASLLSLALPLFLAQAGQLLFQGADLFLCFLAGLCFLLRVFLGFAAGTFLRGQLIQRRLRFIRASVRSASPGVQDAHLSVGVEKHAKAKGTRYPTVGVLLVKPAAVRLPPLQEESLREEPSGRVHKDVFPAPQPGINLRLLGQVFLLMRTFRQNFHH